MNILLNGKNHSIDKNTCLGTLVKELDLTGKRLAVEINREIIPKSKHEQHVINEDDVIEIVYAIGGG